jgi:hypothetical protein
MYKNRIKEWGLSKYLKAEEADRLLSGNTSEELTQKAQRSIMRRKTREQTKKRAHSRNESVSSEQQPKTPFPQPPAALTVTPPTPQPPSSSYTESSIVAEPSPIKTEPTVPFSPVRVQAQRQYSLVGVAAIDDFLKHLRAWTHEAFVTKKWERSQTNDKHQRGRHASRLLASDLQAGIKLMEQKRADLAWVHWKKAVAHFSNKDLFKTWYHETPVRLLFEVSRVAHSGYPEFAAQLLQFISQWANQYLNRNDSRHALYSLYGQFEVDQLRDLHVRAGRCMIEGLSSRLERHDPLLFEVRLNRALDTIWFDPQSDLSAWLPSLDEVDGAYGTNNAYAIYYLLLQAYSLVAKERHSEAEEACAEARQRLDTIVDIDKWRVGMAYRRLGRIQYTKQRFPDARRSFNIALQYVGENDHDADSIMVEVFQCQESMANAMNDKEDAQLWNRMLRQHEERVKQKEEADAAREAAQQQLSPTAAEVMGTNTKRSPSPRPLSRSSTM